MNIFVLDNDINTCAQFHVDKHVVKMPTESAQMLCAANNFYGIDSPYKTSKAQMNHPCTKWVRESINNWLWLKELAIALEKEWKYRYNHDENKTHKAVDVIRSLDIPPLPEIGLTPFKYCMPDVYKVDDIVISYREFYKKDKIHLHSYKNRKKPQWLE